MKYRHVFISILAVLVFGFLFSQDAMALYLWQKYQNADYALILVSNNADLAMNLGWHFFNGGAYDLPRAKKAYLKALKAKPDIVLAHYQLARIYFVEGQFDEAFSEINREIDGNSSNLRALYVRGLIYAYQDDFLRAEDDFNRFIVWAPAEWAGYNDLSWVLLEQEKYAQSREIIKRALIMAPEADNNPWLLNALGVSELNLGSHKDAANAFRRARNLVESLTIADWKKSYPGNDPAAAIGGLSSFKEAISENLRSSEAQL